MRRRRGFAIASLVLGILGLPTLGLLGVGAMASIVLGVVALVKASRAPAEHGGKGLAIAGIALSVLSLFLAPVLGIVAAIAIPSFLRARVSANEATAIGNVRLVMSAEEAYAAYNGGHYDRLDCLARPSTCIPGYSGPAMLETADTATTKDGYRRIFHPGLPPPALAPTVSRSSLSAFAYVAVPEHRNQTGVRSFCGDATGRLCFLADGSTPAVVDGACPADCATLR